MYSRDSRREFLLFLAAISLFFVALGAEFWSPPMPIISLVLFGIGGLFALLAIVFYIYGRVANLGDPSDEIPKLLRQIQATLDTKLDNTNTKLDELSNKLEKVNNNEKHSSQTN